MFLLTRFAILAHPDRASAWYTDEALVPSGGVDVDNRSFDRWLSTVDRIVMLRRGVTTQAVPDLRLRDAFDAGISPEAFCEKELGLPPTTVVLDHHGGIGLLFELLG